MSKPDAVETILARLMPPAMSMESQREIEAMLDELAGPPLAAPAGRPWLRRFRSVRSLGVGIAAAGVIAALVVSKVAPGGLPAVAAHVDKVAGASGVVLVSESDRIAAVTDEGWQEDPDGAAMQALRLNVVEENHFLDEETGIVMQVSEPREEVLLVPVSSF